MQPSTEVPKVYEAISNVTKDLAEKGGIVKDNPQAKKNKNEKVAYGAPNYAYRSIDQVYNALSPALVKNKLIIAPRITEREVTEKTSNKGSILSYVVVKGEFDFISTEDGSKITIMTFGEAMDSGDKATNKAMSVAYKYAAFQAFCIPTEETSQDSDKENYEVITTQKDTKEQPTKKPILNEKSPSWGNAINSYQNYGNLDRVRLRMEVSAEIEEKIKNIVSTLKSSDDDTF